MAQSPQTTVHVFKVALANRKRIWRRIALLSHQTLDDLHNAIFRAFDRYDEHLYSFYFPKPGARGRSAIRTATEFSHPFAAEKPGPFGVAPNNAAKARLDRLKLKPGWKFQYLFDFGDEWWHEVTVESTSEPVGEGEYPRILVKKGDSPAQYSDLDEDDQ
jgi:hypothetical protein